MPQDNENLRFRGKRYIAIARCSTLGQAEHSVPDQLKVIRKFRDEHGMIEIDVLPLEGVSGSLPGSRKDLTDLLERKRTRNDFDAVVLQDTTRMTRGGMLHGNMIEYEFASLGIEIIYVLEQLPQGPTGELVRSIQYYAANEQARSIAKNVARGSMSSLEQGQISHTRCVPYGIDRLYRALDGKARYVIRNLADGSQVKLDPTTGELIEAFGRNPNTNRPAHYRKLMDETVELIPGDPRAVEVIRLIYRRYFIDRWGFAKIACELNKTKVSSPMGRAWHKKTVKLMIRNRIYTGVGIANRSTAAVYYMRAAGAPEVAGTQLKDLVGRKRPKTKMRPQGDWLEVPQEALMEYLPKDIRAAVADYQQQYWSGQAMQRKEQAPRRDRHVDSSYFLKGILVSQQGGYAMRGRASGTGKWRTRYYVVSRTETHPGSLDPLFNRTVPASPIEQVVLHLLQRVLLIMPNLKELLRRRIVALFGATSGTQDRVAPLVAQRTKLQQQREFVFENLDLVGKDESRVRLARLNEDIESLNQALATGQGVVAWDQDRVEETVESLVQQFCESADALRTLPLASLQGMLRLLLSKTEVDIETRAVTLEFRLPKWAIENPSELSDALGLKGMSCHKSTLKAQTSDGCLLMKFRVIWLGRDAGYVGYGIAA